MNDQQNNADTDGLLSILYVCMNYTLDILDEIHGEAFWKNNCRVIDSADDIRDVGNEIAAHPTEAPERLAEKLERSRDRLQRVLSSLNGREAKKHGERLAALVYELNLASIRLRARSAAQS